MSTLRQDLSYCIRMLAKSPGFAAVAILTLALGIGANTAIFSLIDGFLMRALPIQNAQDVVVLKWSARKTRDGHSTSSYGASTQSYEPHRGPPTACPFPQPFFNDVASQFAAFSRVAPFANA